MYTKILYSYNVCFSTSLFKNISEFPKAQFYLAHVYRFCSKVSQNTSKNAWRTTSMSRCFCFESLLMKLHNGKTMDLCLPAFVQSLSNSSKLHHSKDMSVRLCSEFFSKCFKMKRCLSCVCLPVRAPRNIKIVNQPQNVSFSLLKNLLKIFSKPSFRWSMSVSLCSKISKELTQLNVCSLLQDLLKIFSDEKLMIKCLFAPA